MEGWPLPVSNYAKHEVVLAKIVHWLLIVSTVLMPISGMVHSGASGHGFGIFGFEIVHANPNPADPEKVIPLNEFWSVFGQTAHEYIGYVLIFAIVLHVSQVGWAAFFCPRGATR
jgi:cytochrome b561